MDIWDYLDEIRKLTNTGTNYAVAKMIGVSDQAMHNWKKQGSIPDAATCFKIADILHIEREEVLINVNLAGAKKPSDRKVWAAFAGKALSAVSAICLISLSNSGDNWDTDLQKMSLKTSSMGQKNDGTRNNELTIANNSLYYVKLWTSKITRIIKTVADRMTLTGYAA